MMVGRGVHTYKVAMDWGRLPPGWEFNQVPGIAVDSQDRVHVLSRGAHPVLVFDRDGNFLRSWGEGVLTDPHGICFGPDDSCYVVDRDAHAVMKFSPKGKLLMTLGTNGQPAPEGAPFNRPARAALSPSGELYVADGYGNARVHKYSADGRLLFSWGVAGDGPGQFNLPHGVAVDRQGRVFVADRENDRIQIFTGRGEFIAQWTELIRPADIVFDADQNLYVAELTQRVSIFSPKGELLARWGGEASKAPGHFVLAHAMCRDSRGDLYVGEVAGGERLQKFVRKT